MKKLLIALLCLSMLVGVFCASLAEDCAHEEKKEVTYRQDPVYTPVDANTHRITIDSMVYWQCTKCKELFSGKPGPDNVTTEAHTFDAKGVCTKCQYACKHEGTTVVDPAVPATCTATGKTEGAHCSLCNAVITAQQEVPMAAHTPVIDPAVPSTTTVKGKSEGSHCGVCGVVLKAQEPLPLKDNKLTVTKNKTVTIGPNETIQIRTGGKKVKSYKSSNTAVATVNHKGLVTTKYGGTAKITIKLKNGKKITLTVKVKDPKAPKSIEIKGATTKRVKVKKSLTLVPVMEEGSRTRLTWKSSNTKIATVNSKGVVKGKKKGKVRITVTTANGRTAVVTVKVVK